MNIKSKMKRVLASVSAGSMALVLVPISVSAATNTVVVTPTNQQGWSTADIRPGGTVTFVTDADSPLGVGALQLTTDATTSAKAQYLHAADIPLRDVTDLSYFTKQVSALFPEGAPSYQLPALLNGSTGFTTLVFEPYQNPAQGPVVNNVWQDWDVDSGLFWSSRTVTCSGGTILGTPGGPATYTLAQVESTCPEAVVVGFGVNIGTFNPSYTVRTDAFVFNETTYDFEPYKVASDKDECKKDGYKNVTDSDGNSFKNQGQCVSYTNRVNESASAGLATF